MRLINYRLFSKFTISTTSHQHVRISAAQLQIPDGGLEGVKVVACSPHARSVVVRLLGCEHHLFTALADCYTCPACQLLVLS
jgi:hypothetical protein